MEHSQQPIEDFAQHDWLRAEAAGNPELLDLLVEREHLIDQAAASGVMDKPEINEKVGIHSREIVEMKRSLGIPVAEPGNIDTKEPLN